MSVESAAQWHAPAAAPTRPGALRYPASSKMLEAYQTDIARLLADERWEEAESRALALPNIAVSLTEPDGRSSLERYRDWCRTWVEEAGPEELYEDWYRRSSRGDELVEGVPRKALRSLQLHRLIRTGEISFSGRHPQVLQQPAAGLVQRCRALMRATHAWYARRGSRDPLVQSRLSQLAVLR